MVPFDLQNIVATAGEKLFAEHDIILESGDFLAELDPKNFADSPKPSATSNGNILVSSNMFSEPFIISEMSQGSDVPIEIQNSEPVLNSPTEFPFDNSAPKVQTTVLDILVEEAELGNFLDDRYTFPSQTDIDTVSVDAKAVIPFNHDVITPNKGVIELALKGEVLRPADTGIDHQPAATRRFSQGESITPIKADIKDMVGNGVTPPQPLASPANYSQALEPVDALAAEIGTPSSDAQPKANKPVGAINIPIEISSPALISSTITGDVVRVSDRHLVRLQPTAQAHMVNQVVAAVSAPNDDTVEIRLDPPELGKVRVTLTQSENSTLAQVITEKPETADLLRRNATLLTKELTRAGLENITLDFHHSGEHNSPDHAPDEDHPTYLHEDGAVVAPPKPIATAIGMATESLDRRI